MLPDTWARLPEPEAIRELESAARYAYSAAEATNIVAVAGSDVAISHLPRLINGCRRVVILGPTYASHAEAWTAAGHDVHTTQDIADLATADIALVVNPNNPDGRVLSVDNCCAIADAVAERGGLMIVDEAFCDVMLDASVVSELARCPALVVLRSFGKFYGLAGLRLGFVLSQNPVADLLRKSIGDWPVSGPAVWIGRQALVDGHWMIETRKTLADAAADLDHRLRCAGCDIIGGTSLFRLAKHEQAADIFDRLAQAGILVRPFDYAPNWLRVGLPPSKDAAERLSSALRGFEV